MSSMSSDAKSAHQRRLEYAQRVKESRGTSVRARPTATRAPLRAVTNTRPTSRSTRPTTTTKTPTSSRTKTPTSTRTASALTKRTAPSSAQRSAPPAKRIRSAQTTSSTISRSTSQKQAAAVAEARKKEGQGLLKKQAALQTKKETLETQTEEVEVQLKEVAQNIVTTTEALQKARTKQITLEGDRDRIKLEVEQQSQTTQMLQDSLRDTKERLSMQLETQVATYEQLALLHKTLQEQQNTTLGQLKDAKATLAQQEREFSRLDTSLRTVSTELKTSEATNETHADRIEQLQEEIQKHQEQIEQLEQVAREDALVRRQLHETILDLKGTVRVFLRVYQAQAEEEDAMEEELFAFPDPWRGQTLQLNSNETTSQLQFDFDKVYPPTTGQQDVFEGLEDLLRSCVEGAGVNIFTYNTPSGEVPTLSGSGFHELLLFAMTSLLDARRKLKKKGWKISLALCGAAMQGDKVHDLFAECPSARKADRPKSEQCMPASMQYLKIKRSGQLAPLLREVATPEQYVDGTLLFQVHLQAENSSTGEMSHGLLNITHLASPQSQTDPNTAGALNQVISALANQEAVPYRKSPLTTILRHSLHGGAKTLFLVHLDGRSPAVKEHLTTLRFAKEINACNISSTPSAPKKSKKVKRNN